MNNLNALTPTAEKGIEEVKQGITADLYDSFIEFVHGSKNTRATYERALKQFFKYLQDNGITKPNRRDLNAFRKGLEEYTDPITGRKVTHAPATIQLYIQAVKLFFKWTDSENIYPNIAEHLQGAKIDREHKKDYFKPAQIRDILNSIDRTTLQGARDYAIIVLAVTGGLRDIEISRANIEDVSTAGGNPVIYVQGKGHEQKADYVKLPIQTQKVISAYLQARGRVEGTDPLFTSAGNRNNGGRLTTKTISRLIKGYLIQAGYNNARWTAHSLRHTAVTLALLDGKPLDEVQQFARHSNIATTMIYNHAVQRENNTCAQTVANAIF
jgi:integrase/recombinase XerD